MSFSEWKKYTLKELNCKFLSGFAFKSSDYKDSGIPLIKIGNIQNKTVEVNLKGTFVSKELISNKTEKFLLHHGDVLIAMTGQGSVGRVGKLKSETREKVFLNQRVGKFVCDNVSLNIDYLYYLLATEKYQKLLFNTGIGSGQPNLSPEQILSIEIPYLKIETQNKIASILSSLDDAIELHQQTNKTLEEIPKAIFKEWFIDFNFPNATGEMQETEIGKIPVGWTVESFEDVFDGDRGLSYKGAGLAQSDATPMHNLNSVLEGGGYKTIGIKYYNGDYKDKHIVNAGELIIANTEQGHKYMLIGYPAIIPQFYGEHGIFSHHIYRLRPKKKCWLSPDFMYHLLLQPQVRDQVIGFANGTTVNMLKIEGLHKPKFAMPPKELAEKFTAIAKANRLQAEQNIEENQSLSNLRDTLLPKLMKGEIEIKT